jgi:N-acylneuraminate cytidylyltransferase
VFPVVPYSTPIQRALIIENGRILPINSAIQNLRSQDLELSYYDAGQFYWGKFNSWLNKKKLFISKSKVIFLPKNDFVDVNTLEDWMDLKKLYKKYSKQK